MDSTGSTINVFKDAFTQKQITLTGIIGKSIESVFPDYDFEHSVISVNGKRETKDYVIKEKDSVAIRFYPSAGTSSTLAAISFWMNVAFVALAVTSVILWNVCPQFRKWVKGLLGLDEDGDANEQHKNEYPNISGIANQSALDKCVPMILGEHLVTPYYVGRPYTSLLDAKGKKRIFHAMFMLGYNNISIKNIKLKYTDLASNNEGVTGYEADLSKRMINCDSSYFRSVKENIKLELSQDENECQLYPQRVIQQDFQTEIQKISGHEAVPINVVSATNPMAIEIEVGFQGLFHTKDDGGLGESSVAISVEYQIGDSPWQKLFFADDDRNKNRNNWTFGGLDYITHTDPVTGEEVIDGVDKSNAWNIYKDSDNEEMRFVVKKNFTYVELANNSAMFDESNPSENFVKIRITRLNNNSTSTRDCDKIYLTAVRTWCFDYDKSKSAKRLVPIPPVCDEYKKITARLAFECESNEALKDQLEKLNFIGISRCPVPSVRRNQDDSITYYYDENNVDNPATWTDSNNPAAVALLLFKHHALKNNRYETEKINLDKLAELYTYCEKSQFTCNTVLATQQKFGDIMYKVLACGHAFPVMDNNQFDFIIDKPQENPVMILNNHNILAKGRKNTKEFNEIPDRFKIKYINKNNNYLFDYIDVWRSDEIKSKYERGELNPNTENVTLDCYTDAASAWLRGRHDFAKRILRPETWIVPMSVDGDLIGVGDMVEIQDDTLLMGIGDGGIIRELIEDDEYIHGFITDSGIPIEDLSKSYCVKVIQSDGVNEPVSSVYELYILYAGVHNSFRFKYPIKKSEVTHPMLKIGDLCTFGEYGKVAERAICLSKARKEDNTFELILVPYREELYLYDDRNGDFDMPEFSSNVTLPVTGNGLSKVPTEITRDEINNAINSVWQDTISEIKVDYAISESGTDVPDDESWIEDFSELSIISGMFLWTRTTTIMKSGNKKISYSIAYQGEDGTHGSNYNMVLNASVIKSFGQETYSPSTLEIEGQKVTQINGETQVEGVPSFFEVSFDGSEEPAYWSQFAETSCSIPLDHRKFETIMVRMYGDSLKKNLIDYQLVQTVSDSDAYTCLMDDPFRTVLMEYGVVEDGNNVKYAWYVGKHDMISRARVFQGVDEIEDFEYGPFPDTTIDGQSLNGKMHFEVCFDKNGNKTKDIRIIFEKGDGNYETDLPKTGTVAIPVYLGKYLGNSGVVVYEVDGSDDSVVGVESELVLGVSASNPLLAYFSWQTVSEGQSFVIANTPKENVANTYQEFLEIMKTAKYGDYVLYKGSNQPPFKRGFIYVFNGREFIEDNSREHSAVFLSDMLDMLNQDGVEFDENYQAIMFVKRLIASNIFADNIFANKVFAGQISVEEMNVKLKLFTEKFMVTDAVIDTLFSREIILRRNGIIRSETYNEMVPDCPYIVDADGLSVSSILQMGLEEGDWFYYDGEDARIFYGSGDDIDYQYIRRGYICRIETEITYYNGYYCGVYTLEEAIERGLSTRQGGFKIFASGKAIFNSDTDIGGNLKINGKTKISGNTSVGGIMSFQKNIDGMDDGWLLLPMKRPTNPGDRKGFIWIESND